MASPRSTRTVAALVLSACLIAGCGAGDDETAKPEPTTAARTATGVDGVVRIDGRRGLYVRCTGTGSPTVVMEGGDDDTSDSYAFAEPTVSKVARTCVYDRANLGRSDPAPGPRGLQELVSDLERLLKAAKIPGPYVLVGTSGGGYITAGYAAAHPRQIAGMVFVDTGRPYRNPPAGLVADTAWNNPANVGHRDYLQVEKDAWRARKRIGDIPVRIISVDYGDAAQEEGERRNASDQRGWLVLSARAKQIVANTSHSVEEDDPDLVIDAILDVVKAAR
jgi:pimeloyl-ACP methyl ester carboxylesterase